MFASTSDLLSFAFMNVVNLVLYYITVCNKVEVWPCINIFITPASIIRIKHFVCQNKNNRITLKFIFNFIELIFESYILSQIQIRIFFICFSKIWPILIKTFQNVFCVSNSNILSDIFFKQTTLNWHSNLFRIFFILKYGIL